MSELSAQQIEFLATALKDEKLAAQFRAVLGIHDQNANQPAPSDTRRTEDSVSPPGQSKKEDEFAKTQELNARPRQETTSASDFLSTMHDYVMIRRVPQRENYYIPNAIRAFHTLHHMDKLIIRKFKARRAASLMFPPLHVEYFAILWSLQTARCLHFAGYLEKQEDRDFLDFFLDKYPLEKLVIPGPLLPFFKAITTYRHENPLYKRISPGFPAETFSSSNGRSISHNDGNVFFPNVPLIVDVRSAYTKKIFGDDYDSANPEGNIKNVKFPFPFANKSTPAADEWNADVTIGGHTFAAKHDGWSTTAAAALTTPGLLFALPVNADIVKNVASSILDMVNPNAKTSAYGTPDLRSFLRMEKTNWFANILPIMSEYCALWTGSGALSDCSVDGPSTGAYIYKYATSETAPTQASAPFRPESQFNLAGSTYTTISTPQASDERLAAFTQVHATLASDHWINVASTTRRNGNVWDIRPIYGPSVKVTSADTVASALEPFIDPRVAK